MADEIVPIQPRAARSLMRPLVDSARGMSVQQSFLEVIARNIANAETTRLPEGGAYQRQIGRAYVDPVTGDLRTMVEADSSPGRKVFEPGHPDADAKGFVEYPNVDVQSEIVDLMVVRRMYEANATVFQAAKRMLRRALDI